MGVIDLARTAFFVVSQLGSNPNGVMSFLLIILVLGLLWMVMTAWKSRFSLPPTIPVKRRQLKKMRKHSSNPIIKELDGERGE